MALILQEAGLFRLEQCVQEFPTSKPLDWKSLMNNGKFSNRRYQHFA